MAKVMVTEEEKAFLGRMYEQYYDEAVRYARSLTGNSDDAQQIVQDTFVSLLEKGVSDLRERDKFKSYLMTCVRNRFLNQRKKAHREEGGELLVDELFDATGEGRFVSVLREEESIDPALAYEHKELKQELENCLAQLPDEQREVIYLKSILQMKEREIAQLQGVAQATVKSRIRYARARLSQLILEREKKTGVKLHSVVPLLPLLRFLYSQETFPQKSFAELCVAAETGAAVAGAASSTAASAASSTAASAASSTAAGAASSTAAGAASSTAAGASATAETASYGVAEVSAAAAGAISSGAAGAATSLVAAASGISVAAKVALGVAAAAVIGTAAAIAVPEDLHRTAQPEPAAWEQNDDSATSLPATETMVIAAFPDLGEYELHEPARYQDGIIRFQYDGNTLLPFRLPYDGNIILPFSGTDSMFDLLEFTYADLREWPSTETYGYIYYGMKAYEQDLDAVAEQEEVHFLLGSPAEESGIEKIKYGTNTDNCISYLYHYQEDTGAYIYDLLVVKNLKGADGLEGSAVVLVESDDMAVILAARQMADTIEIVGTQMDNALSEESLSRTDRIYELLCPEQAAAIKNPVEVEGGSIFEAFSIENLENQNADKAEWAIWFEKPTYILAPGEKVTPVLIGPGKDEKIKYRISNENVATVNAKGEVTGIADGFVMLVATNEHGASCNTYCDVIAPEGGE